MSDSDFSSFDAALKKLELEEEDLKRLISAGEIRAFREGSQMRLRAEDVERVAGELGVGESVSEDDAGEVLEVEDLSLDDGDEDEGMVTTQLSEEDTLLDDDLEVVEVSDDDDDASVGAAPVAGSRRAGGRASARVRGESDEAKEGGGILAAAIVTTVLLVFGLPFAIGMLEGRTTGVTSGVVGIFAGEE